MECALEDDEREENRSICSRSSRLSRKSAASRSSRKSTSSRKSAGKSKRSSSCYVEEAETDSEQSASQSEQNEKKSVKKMNYTDENGEEGLYTGYVNAQYKPHGSGKLVYNNGKRFKGEWCEGTKIHGKISYEKSQKKKPEKKDTKKSKEHSKASMKSSTSSSGGSVKVSHEKDSESNMKQKHEQKQGALKEYKELYNTAKVVKNMVFIDFFGDPGRFTGEVNKSMLPHGVGTITYDHGLVQEGKWVNGVLDEDSSTVASPRMKETREGSRRRARSKDP